MLLLIYRGPDPWSRGNEIHHSIFYPAVEFPYRCNCILQESMLGTSNLIFLFLLGVTSYSDSFGNYKDAEAVGSWPVAF
jgi:hypothetical protein